VLEMLHNSQNHLLDRIGIFALAAINIGAYRKSQHVGQHAQQHAFIIGAKF
jgi:hypothetical protein